MKRYNKNIATTIKYISEDKGLCKLATNISKYSLLTIVILHNLTT